MKLISTTTLLALTATATGSALPISPRQTPSSDWQYNCKGSETLAKPADFKAFDLGGCTAQLTFTKDRYTGYQWNFDAIYADGSRVERKPFQDNNNFGVSSTYFPNLGNNFVTRQPDKSAFTAVHEFTDVCKDGSAPVAWVFYTTSTNSCGAPAGYRYTSPRVDVVGGVSRPAKVAGTALRRTNAAGDFTVSWAAATGAAAYSVIVEYPTGTDEAGNPYRNYRGARIQVRVPGPHALTVRMMMTNSYCRAPPIPSSLPPLGCNKIGDVLLCMLPMLKGCGHSPTMFRRLVRLIEV